MICDSKILKNAQCMCAPIDDCVISFKLHIIKYIFDIQLLYHKIPLRTRVLQLIWRFLLFYYIIQSDTVLKNRQFNAIITNCTSWLMLYATCAVPLAISIALLKATTSSGTGAVERL